MNNFNVTLDSRQHDISATLAVALAEMGSLAASRQTYARLVVSLGLEVPSYLQAGCTGFLAPTETAKAVVEEAVPEEGEIHPARAVVEFATINVVEFMTPGGVRVALVPLNRCQLELAICFHRESQYLATMILSQLARRVRRVRKLLAQASAELAEAQGDEIILPAPSGQPQAPRVRRLMSPAAEEFDGGD